jgi:hypothetical protein
MPFVNATMTSDSATTLHVSINPVTIETPRHHAVESRHPTQKNVGTFVTCFINCLVTCSKKLLLAALS